MTKRGNLDREQSKKWDQLTTEKLRKQFTKIEIRKALFQTHLQNREAQDEADWHLKLAGMLE